MTTFRWKPAARVAIDAQIAGEALEAIRTFNNGRLESEDVVEAARADEHPLHPAFEWDNDVAAEAYRIEQAKYLIRSIEIEIEHIDRPATPIRAFVSVQRDEDRSYTSTLHALSDAELRAQVIASAWRELEAWRQRHAELIEFGRIFTAIDQARGAE